MDLTSTKQTKQGNISSNLREIVPANRSSLATDKIFPTSLFKGSTYMAQAGKGSSIGGKPSVQDSDAETDGLIESCTMKKRRLLITGPNQSKQSSENASYQNLHEKGKLLVSDDIVAHMRTADLNIQKQKNVIHQTVPRDNEETKGSAFLSQVIFFQTYPQRCSLPIHCIYMFIFRLIPMLELAL